MNWFIAVAAYVIIWWVVIFAVLPFGVQHAEKADPGHAAGAPANPRLLLKAGITSLIAAVIWLGFFLAVQHDLVNFRSLS
jgi:predicted secreted protein